MHDLYSVLNCCLFRFLDWFCYKSGEVGGAQHVGGGSRKGPPLPGHHCPRLTHTSAPVQQCSQLVAVVEQPYQWYNIALAGQCPTTTSRLLHPDIYLQAKHRAVQGSNNICVSIYSAGSNQPPLLQDLVSLHNAYIELINIEHFGCAEYKIAE